MKPPISLPISLIVCGVLIFIALPWFTTGQEKAGSIHLQEIDGRSWLVDASGQPFFANGVTHVSARNVGGDVAGAGKALRELGFNAFGYGCAPQLKQQLPYIEGRQLVPTSLYRTSDGSFAFVDVFDPGEQAKLEEAIRKMCLANKDNPNLIGYCWTDLGAWPLKNSTGENWVEAIRALPAEAPGQKAYQAFLSEWSGDSEDGEARDLAFLRRIAREYFRVAGEANRKYDPHHLVFGDRMTLETAIPEVVEEMLPYVDGIAIQPQFRPGFPQKRFDQLHQLSGKPILICDFAVRFAEEGKTIRGWKPEATPKIAGERYAEYVRAARETPYIIGVFWCNPVNSKPGFNKTGIKQGIFDQGLTPRPDLNEAIRQLNAYLKGKTPEKKA